MAALFAGLTSAQATLEDYRRGQELQTKARGLVVNLPGTPNWIDGANHFWYSRAVTGGTEFLIVDAVGAAKKPAFDHDRPPPPSIRRQAASTRVCNSSRRRQPEEAARRGGRAGAAPAADALTF
jgi:hypothetical protein